MALEMLSGFSPRAAICDSTPSVGNGILLGLVSASTIGLWATKFFLNEGNHVINREIAAIRLINRSGMVLVGTALVQFVVLHALMSVALITAKAVLIIGGICLCSYAILAINLVHYGRTRDERSS